MKYFVFGVAMIFVIPEPKPTVKTVVDELSDLRKY